MRGTPAGFRRGPSKEGSRRPVMSMSMKVTLTPAAAKGYSHSLRVPLDLWRRRANRAGRWAAIQMRLCRAMQPPPRKSLLGSACCQPMSFQRSHFRLVHASPGKAKLHNALNASCRCHKSGHNNIKSSWVASKMRPQSPTPPPPPPHPPFTPGTRCWGPPAASPCPCSGRTSGWCRPRPGRPSSTTPSMHPADVTSLVTTI